VNRIFVIANGFHQFVNWCRENKVSERSPLVSYIAEGEWYKMQGIVNPSVVYYGTFYERKDIYDIKQFVQSRMRSNTVEVNEHILQQLKPKTRFNKVVNFIISRFRH
jgi:hypothetical protein